MTGKIELIAHGEDNGGHSHLEAKSDLRSVTVMDKMMLFDAMATTLELDPMERLFIGTMLVQGPMPGTRIDASLLEKMMGGGLKSNDSRRSHKAQLRTVCQCFLFFLQAGAPAAGALA